MAEIPAATVANRRGGKSAAAFRTISEVARELDVPQHVLRFWETKFSQIKPLKRGGGRRYYRPEDIVLLQRIKALLYKDGYTIRGVQKLLHEGGAKALPTGPTVPTGGVAETVTIIDTARAGGPVMTRGDGLSVDKRTALEAALGELVAVRELLKRSS